MPCSLLLKFLFQAWRTKKALYDCQKVHTLALPVPSHHSIGSCIISEGICNWSCSLTNTWRSCEFGEDCTRKCTEWSRLIAWMLFSFLIRWAGCQVEESDISTFQLQELARTLCGLIVMLTRFWCTVVKKEGLKTSLGWEPAKQISSFFLVQARRQNSLTLQISSW